MNLAILQTLMVSFAVRHPITLAESQVYASHHPAPFYIFSHISRLQSMLHIRPSFSDPISCRRRPGIR